VTLRVDTQARTLTAFGRTIPCVIGKNGAIPAADKREGDGMTPLGIWPLRTILFRPDRVAPLPGLSLPWRWLRPDDGWSDDPADAAYNRPVRHPRGFSAEHLWRDDQAYDAIVTLGHNDAPPEPGHGSAIFLHCRNDKAFTEGCIAIERTELLALLPQLAPGDSIDIHA